MRFGIHLVITRTAWHLFIDFSLAHLYPVQLSVKGVSALRKCLTFTTLFISIKVVHLFNIVRISLVGSELHL